MALTLVSLLEQERLWAWLAGAYVSTALAYSAVGERWGAIRYAYLATEMEKARASLDAQLQSEQQALREALAASETMANTLADNRNTMQVNTIKGVIVILPPSLLMVVALA